MKPSALNTDRSALLDKIKAANFTDVASVLWLSDGLQSNSAEDFAKGLQAIAPLQVYAEALCSRCSGRAPRLKATISR